MGCSTPCRLTPSQGARGGAAPPPFRDRLRAAAPGHGGDPRLPGLLALLYAGGLMNQIPQRLIALHNLGRLGACDIQTASLECVELEDGQIPL